MKCFRALLFWLPMGLFRLVCGFLKRNHPSQKIGTFFHCWIALVLASPWIVPESPSSAVGTFGFIAGPCIMI